MMLKWLLVCTMVMALMASPVLGAETVIVSIKDKKVAFTGFNGDRKFTVKRENQV
jgi:hypothetical protein